MLELYYWAGGYDWLNSTKCVELVYIVWTYDCIFFSTPLQQGAEMVNKIKAVYGFKISGGPGGETATWVVDVKNGNGSVEKNSSSE